MRRVPCPFCPPRRTRVPPFQLWHHVETTHRTPEAVAWLREHALEGIEGHYGVHGQGKTSIVVVVPKRIAYVLGIRRGDTVRIVLEGNQMVVEKDQPPPPAPP